MPRRQRYHLRYYRIVAEIVALERGLVDLSGISRDLQRRIAVRRREGE